MTQLEKFYKEQFKTGSMPRFSKLTEEQKKILESSNEFSEWRKKTLKAEIDVLKAMKFGFAYGADFGKVGEEHMRITVHENPFAKDFRVGMQTGRFYSYMRTPVSEAQIRKEIEEIEIANTKKAKELAEAQIKNQKTFLNSLVKQFNGILQRRCNDFQYAVEPKELDSLLRELKSLFSSILGEENLFQMDWNVSLEGGNRIVIQPKNLFTFIILTGLEYPHWYDRKWGTMTRYVGDEGDYEWVTEMNTFKFYPKKSS